MEFRRVLFRSPQYQGCSGTCPPPGFPYTLGIEVAGRILALPASEAILNDKEYQSRNFKVGDKVVVVRQDCSLSCGCFLYSRVPNTVRHWCFCQLQGNALDKSGASSRRSVNESRGSRHPLWSNRLDVPQRSLRCQAK